MRASIVHIALLAVMAALSGCTSTAYVNSKVHLQPFSGGTRPTYVTNPELHREYEILCASGIYQLSSDREGARRLTLLPLKQYGRCGNPLMLSALTLGIVPGFLPGAYVFEYDLESDGAVERYEHLLPVYERVSIWEWLVRCDRQKVFAEALAWSNANKRPNQSLQRTAG